MATLLQIRNKADAKLAEFWPLLVARQTSYFSKHGKYFQLKISPEEIMIDGVDTQFVTKVPSDEKNTLDVGFQFESPLPFQIEIHEWNGRSKGFKAFVYIKLNDGRIYSRNRDSDGNDSGWFEYQILQWL